MDVCMYILCPNPDSPFYISFNFSFVQLKTIIQLKFLKVSPLKSLLREDLKRRISARANNRASRNSNNNNCNNSNTASGGICSSGNNNNNNISNSDRISNNSNNNNNNNSNNDRNSFLQIRSETSSVVATTSNNGIITSTGPETELIITATSKRHLQCLFCGIEFPDQTLYFLHKGCHSESNPWKCNICGEQLQNVYEFNSHLLSKSHQ